jgi:hypothetical protein
LRPSPLHLAPLNAGSGNGTERSDCKGYV